MAYEILSLTSYPVKSCAGVSCSTAELTARGFAGDRRWMVIEPGGRFVTGRSLPLLVRLQVETTDAGVVLRFGEQAIVVAAPSQTKIAVKIWQDSIEVYDAGEQAAQWLSTIFARDLRLVWQAPDQTRLLPEAKRLLATDEVSFADAYPLLLIGSASLDDLNRRLKKPVTMASFRPNIVVKTTEPYVEDTWREIEVGGLNIVLASQCSRCIFTTVDPVSGEVSVEKEPLATLRNYRRADSGKIMFGMNAITRSLGLIGEGMAVTINAKD